MNLYETLSKAIEQDNIDSTKIPNLEALSTNLLSNKIAPTQLKSLEVVESTKPILLLNALPLSINPDDFKNVLSTENPDGNLSSLWAFRQLVDPIPMFSRYYSPSTKSTESVYASIVDGATIKGSSPFTAQIISESRQSLSQIKYSNMDGTPGTWAPVYSSPSDWYDTSNGRYKKIEFNLSKIGDPDNPFTVIGGNETSAQLKFCSDNEKSETIELDSSTKIHKITMKYLEVTLNRQWYNELLFNITGWSLTGQPEGFCSSGDLNSNNGIFPLVPSSILFGYDVSVDADWSTNDKMRIDDAIVKGIHVLLENLIINPAEKQSHLQVIGWVTSLIPFSPK
jgi:hypothetical protein